MQSIIFCFIFVINLEQFVDFIFHFDIMDFFCVDQWQKLLIKSILIPCCNTIKCGKVQGG